MKKRTNKRKTTEQFIADAVAVHGDKYNYSKVEYVKNRSKVLVTCPIHGDWGIAPDNHLRGQGCPKCGWVKVSEAVQRSALNKRDWDFEQPEDYKLIPLSQGKFAKVDNEDFDRLKEINWCLSAGRYVTNLVLGYIHRFIMNAPPHLEVDHENGDGLDNRKSNLRLATKQQNQMNQRVQKIKKSSKYKGVSWDKSKSKWVSAIKKNYKRINLGRFLNEEEAAKAYDKKAIELFGEFAYLNFPELKDEYLK